MLTATPASACYLSMRQLDASCEVMMMIRDAGGRGEHSRTARPFKCLDCEGHGRRRSRANLDKRGGVPNHGSAMRRPPGR